MESINVDRDGILNHNNNIYKNEKIYQPLHRKSGTGYARRNHVIRMYLVSNWLRRLVRLGRKFLLTVDYSLTGDKGSKANLKKYI